MVILLHWVQTKIIIHWQLNSLFFLQALNTYCNNIVCGGDFIFDWLFFVSFIWILIFLLYFILWVWIIWFRCACLKKACLKLFLEGEMNFIWNELKLLLLYIHLAGSLGSFYTLVAIERIFFFWVVPCPVCIMSACEDAHARDVRHFFPPPLSGNSTDTLWLQMHDI